jgi:8-oxo-dGTP diphosphatase
MNAASDQEGRFMVAVGAMIEHDSSGKILLVKRSDKANYLPGIWEDLGGRIKQFEEPEDALHREVREETGLDIEILKPLAIFHDYYGERTADNELLIITYWCKAKSDQVVLSDEHTEYRWVTAEEALVLAEHIGVRRDIQAWIDEVT